MTTIKKHPFVGAILVLVISLLFVAGSGTSFAEDQNATPSLEGTYAVQGTNPGGKGDYTGSVIISQTGETLKVVWNVGTAYIGTGVLTGDVLSVAYTDENKRFFGIVAYKISGDGKTLEGTWASHNGKSLGTETLLR